jgi:hypothetical protein
MPFKTGRCVTMKNRILSGAGAILSGLLLSIGPQTIFKV